MFWLLIVYTYRAIAAKCLNEQWNNEEAAHGRPHRPFFLNVLIECEQEHETAKVLDVCQYIQFKDASSHGNLNKVLPHDPVAVEVEHDELAHIHVHEIRHHHVQR